MLLIARALSSPGRFAARDLTLDRGEVVVVAGPSGSGKTSFLRALADLDPTEAEELSTEGRARAELSGPAWRRRVTYVRGDTPPLAPTVGADRERTRRLAPGREGSAAAALPALAPERLAEQLSTGERQLLALHRGLIAAPRVLLLDEPTSGMDPDLARRVEQVLREWVGRERALLWISHDASLGERLGVRTERFE